ncbi:lipopolysaccharide biosynthesis protein [Pseudooceanicola aestuarii]|uniref:lipopolysaccharide biosynthesis protein n=1 Tax=Pseudooceanicola aestuarii TaxID=2697319 RepID=UPI001EF81D51|nr:lipopolysaccharide biosynthesis protein [Pseudooceanicola aestuarii]
MAGLSWHLGLTLLRRGAGFAAMLVVVRALDRSQYGHYQFVFTILGLAGITALSGMKAAVTQSVARGHPATYRQAARLSFMASTLGGAAVAGYGLFVWHHGNAELALALVLAGMLFPTARGFLTWQAFLLGQREFARSARVQGSAALLSALLLVSAVGIWPGQLVPAALVFLSVQSVQNILMHRRILRLLPSETHAEQGALRYGVRSTLYDVANVVGNGADRILLFATLSPESLAGYAVATRLPELAKDLIQGLRNVLVPDLAKRARPSPTLHRQLNRLVLGLAGGMVAVAVAVVPWLLPLVFTAGYADMVLASQLLILSVAAGAYATVKSAIIFSRLDEHGVRAVQLWPNLARILAAIALIPPFGIMGAVAATLLYRVMLSVAVHLHMRRDLRPGHSEAGAFS